MKKVSIIMVNYNGIKCVGKKDLTNAVKSFLETNYHPFEFIFVDNASTDGSINFVKSIFQRYPHIQTKLIKNSKNIGFAGGCNKGIEESEGDYLCLVNNDDMAIDKNWLKELVKALESHKSAGAVFAKKLKWDNPSEIDARGMTINPAGIASKSLIEEDKIMPCLIWQTPVLFKRELIDKLGGKFFDDDYIILHDDTDSSLRIWLAGYKIFYVPSSVVLHKRSATMKKLPVEFVAFHGRKNIIQTIIKCYQLNNLMKWLPITLGIYCLSIFYYLKICRVDQAKATIKAILWNLSNLKMLIRKRKYIQKNVRKVSDETIMKLMKSFRLSEILKGEKVWPR